MRISLLFTPFLVDGMIFHFDAHGSGVGCGVGEEVGRGVGTGVAGRQCNFTVGTGMRRPRPLYRIHGSVTSSGTQAFEVALITNSRTGDFDDDDSKVASNGTFEFNPDHVVTRH